MIVALVVLPLAGALMATLRPAWGPRLASATMLASAGIALALAIVVWRQGGQSHDLGGWVAPLGIALRADGLTALMLLLSATIAVPVTAYAAGYYGTGAAGWKPSATFWPLVLLLIGSLHALFLSGDLFNLYVTLELITLAGVGLVLLSEEPHARLAAMRYLLAGFLASLLYLLGVAILYGAYGYLDLEELAGVVAAEPVAALSAALVTAGLLVKSALFPLHFWLPRAHAAAPAPVSALLSSLVVTASFYLVLRLWTGVFGAVVTHGAATLLGALGTGAILWGSIQALRQQHLKVMIAYSTVAQVGYLFLVLPLLATAALEPGGAEGWGRDAWNGGVYHAVSHGLAKAAMFLAAGTIAEALGSDRIVGISGIARQLPVSTYAFGLAGMTLIGLPPSGGFVAKWLLLSASFASGQWWWSAVMLLGGLLTASYIFLVLGQELSQAGSDRDVELRPVPRSMEYTALALAVAALILGVRVTEPLALLRVGAPVGAI